MHGTEAHGSDENIDYIANSDGSSTVEDDPIFFGPPSFIHIPHVERVQTLQDKVSIEFYKLAKDHNLSNVAYDKFIKLFNNYIKDDQFENKPLLSRYHAEKRMTDLYPVKPDCYDICSNNCGIFLDSSQEKCTECGTTRTQHPQTLSYFPLAKQLACLVSQQSFRSLLLPRSERENNEDPRVLEDIWDGNIYQDQKDNLFKDDLTLCLGLQQDGFVPFNRGGGSIILVNALIMNLPSFERYKIPSMIQAMAIPVKPVTHCLDNFLIPLFEELQALQNYGVLISCNDGDYHLKVHVLFMTGDIVGVQELIHHKTFRSTYGCHMCYIQPKSIPSRNGNGFTKSFAGNPSGVYEMRRKVDFTEEAFLEGSIIPQRGITAPTPLAKLNAFHGFSYVGLDALHLFGSNVGKHIWEMIVSSYSNADIPFRLPQKRREYVDVHKKLANMRSVDWVLMLLFVLPTIICDQIVEEYKEQSREHVKALVALSKGCAIALSWYIEQDDIVEMESYMRNSEVPDNMYTINMHLLLHCGEITRRLGPLSGISAASLERAIGYTKRLIKSKKKPGINVANVLLRHQACRYFGVIYDDTNNEEDKSTMYNAPDNENIYHVRSVESYENSDGSATPHSPEFWGYFNSSTDKFIEVDLQAHLHTYWQRRFGQSTTIPEKHNLRTDIIIGKRMFFNGTVYDSLEHKCTTQKICHFVKLSIPVDKYVKRSITSKANWKVYFGEVLLFVAHKFNDDIEEMLCLVRLVNASLNKNTGCPYGSQSIGDDGYRKLYVVDCDNIDSHTGIIKMGKDHGIDSNECYYIYPEMVANSDIDLHSVKKVSQ
ncbi:hypothetical protein INT45_007730 [Circinella minor]|uniref:Transposase domain-containing protein n=1 Tax=Circinella minor TaxID=1195481 RepID=A0A8H7RHX6_9FUNG|nr:hypothetical protein INT45_007730 [Circinella minor]